MSHSNNRLIAAGHLPLRYPSLLRWQRRALPPASARMGQLRHPDAIYRRGHPARRRFRPPRQRTWSDSFELPADKSRIGIFSLLTDQSEARLRGILEGLQARKWPAGSPQARIAAPMPPSWIPTVSRRAGWLRPSPISTGLLPRRAATTCSPCLPRRAFAAPLGIGVDADEKDSARYALYLGQAGLGLPDRDYYLVDNPRNLEIRAKYLGYLTFLLGKSGHADPRGAAQAVMQLETDLARAMWDRTVGRNRDLTYNKLTLAELAQAVPGGAARALIDKGGAGAADYVIVAQLPPTAEERAAAKLTPEQAAKLGGGMPATAKLIDEAPLASWQAWLTSALPERPCLGPARRHRCRQFRLLRHSAQRPAATAAPLETRDHGGREPDRRIAGPDLCPALFPGGQPRLPWRSWSAICAGRWRPILPSSIGWGLKPAARPRPSLPPSPRRSAPPLHSSAMRG